DARSRAGRRRAARPSCPPGSVPDGPDLGPVLLVDAVHRLERRVRGVVEAEQVAVLVYLGVRTEEERLVAVVLPGALPLEALARLQHELPWRVLLELRIGVALLVVDELASRAVDESPPDTVADAAEVVVARERHDVLHFVVGRVAGHVADA